MPEHFLGTLFSQVRIGIAFSERMWFERMTSTGPTVSQFGVRQVAEAFYTVGDLPPEQFRQAYPLVQIVRENWSLDFWLDHATDRFGHTNSRNGVLCVQTQRQYIYALAAFEIGVRKVELRSIYIDLVCVVDFGSGTISTLLFDALERRGRVQGCRKIILSLPEAERMSKRFSDRSLSAVLQKRGYIKKGDQFSQELR